MIGSREECILQYNHSKIFDSGKEIEILDSDKPMWIELIHNSNVINNIEKQDIETQGDER